ncbi:MAG TPA: alpha/beta hydrolase [Pseudonocardiaceae bacterium]|jgi:dienelactone hydrolase|nr:alpha/beta hydrolase [Pseudonocardiaceae bacterium]
MARSATAARRVIDELARSGPHRVLRGDLGLIGMPGVVFTPGGGVGLPAVAFGHGWLQPTSRYEELLRHLASWGVVAAAPATQHGLLPAHREFATDLRTALDMCVGVRLGDGEISVDPDRLALAGHGMGGGCAVLAAAADQRCRVVATLALAETLPSAVAAAHRATIPGIHITGGKDRVAPPVAHADQVAKAWAGPVQVRTLPKASHLGFLQGRHWSDLILDGSPEYHTRRIARALVTAFLLHHLTGSTEYDELLETDLPVATLDLAGRPAPA